VQTTGHQSIEDRDINIHRRENLKSHMLYILIKNKVTVIFLYAFIFIIGLFYVTIFCMCHKLIYTVLTTRYFCNSEYVRIFGVTAFKT
jgi:hypothetical protein